MKIINQPPGGRACAGCVAAMIAERSYEDFHEYVGFQPPPFNSKQVFDYLNSKGIIPGYHINYIYPVHDEGGRLIAYKADVPIYQPAYVVTIIGQATHAIFWDGQKVWDPNNDEPTDNICDYEIISWTPLFIPLKGVLAAHERQEEREKYISVEGGTVTIRTDPNAKPAAQLPCAITGVKTPPAQGVAICNN